MNNGRGNKAGKMWPVLLAVIGLFSLPAHANSASIQTYGEEGGCTGGTGCCIPYCKLRWSDSKGCTGEADILGDCAGTAFQPHDDTNDTGADICDGAGAFLCTSVYGRYVAFVVNEEQQVSASYMQTPEVGGGVGKQCASASSATGDCGSGPKYIGKAGDHNCKALLHLLGKAELAGKGPQKC